MTMPDRVQRCTICASEGDLESHHLALRANHEAATVPLCRACHDKQTARQRQAGLIDRRNASADADPGTAVIHALTEGTTGILTAHARDTGSKELAALDERARRATLRLLALTSDKRPGQTGPRPISNDRRGTKTRRRKTSKRRQRTDQNAVESESLQALTVGILPALAAVIIDLIGRDAEPAGSALKLAAGADPLARGLQALQDHPRSDELTASAQHATALGVNLFKQLAAAGGARAAAAGGQDTGAGEGASAAAAQTGASTDDGPTNQARDAVRAPVNPAHGAGAAPEGAAPRAGEIDTEQLAATLRDYLAAARAQLGFALALAAGDEPVPAFEGFLDQRGPA